MHSLRNHYKMPPMTRTTLAAKDVVGALGNVEVIRTAARADVLART